MKKALLPLFLFLMLALAGRAQLPNGSVAPDFTVTDLNGQTYNLYSLLDQGKTVFLDFSATWCGPCWNYHNSGAFKNVWNMYGPPGTGEAMVFFIESDASTNTACLYGPSGCVGGTQGDWVTGTPYPIVEAAGVASQYAISYYPTIMVVCPADKKVYEAGQQSANGLWAYAQSNCPEPTIEAQINNIENITCFGDFDGAIDISPVGGSPPYFYSWSNGATSQDLTNIPAGNYTVTISNAAGWSGITGPITVPGPNSPLNLGVLGTSPVGCNGVLGSITVEAFGGWPGGYSYLWNNGQAGQTASGLTAGNYTVTVTDPEGCTAVITENLPPPAFPTASIVAPDPLDCFTTQLELDGASGSSNGPNYSFQWFASNGGNIISGANTSTPLIDEAGTYTMQITDTDLNCSSFAVTNVTANIVLPDVDAGADGVVSCDEPSIDLNGNGSVGQDIDYEWSTPDGNIVSGENTLNPTIDAPGTYTLTVINNANGCENTDIAEVTGTNQPPELTMAADTLTCATVEVTIETDIDTDDAEFVWSGPNGYASEDENPVVTDDGWYHVTATDSLTACVVEDSILVEADVAEPGATATAGAITCDEDEAELNGGSGDPDATYAWTGPNGYTSNEEDPTVNEVGEYNLVTTSPSNGCTSEVAVNVDDNTTPPEASAETPGNLNCDNLEIELDGTGSAQGNEFEYAWSTANGNIVSGQNGLSPIVDAAGDYELLVTNTETGCTNTASVSVQSSPPVEATATVDANVACNGQENGSATAEGDGGDGDFSFAWSTGETTASVSDLAAGTYQVVVTDGEGCSSTASVTVTEPEVLEANATATAQTQNGVDDGTATADPMGGTPNFGYEWSNGETSQSISNLAPGTYTVTVTDDNGCTSVESVTVNSFNCTISADIAGTNVTCNGAEDGGASVSITGGATPITYAWSNGETTESVSGLAPGTYTVEIVDANNCPATLSVVITEPLELEPNASATGQTQNGVDDGTATANPTGGTGSYTYEWNNGATTQMITNLAPGTYTVVITDENGCTASESVNVQAFDCAVLASIAATDVSCNGAEDGTATVSLQGGNSPYTYNWSNGETTSNITNLGAGDYTVTVVDADGCEVTETTSVTEPDVLSLDIDNIVDVLCPDDENGSIATGTEGGVTPYSYEWSNGVTTPDLNNASPGTYTVVVTDGNGCTEMNDATIESTDDEAPVITSGNSLKLVLDANGEVQVDQASIGLSASDNCAVNELLWSPMAFTCDDIGTQTVTATATDNSGNTSELQIDVEVVDETAPVVECPANIVVCPDESLVEYDSPSAIDNCLASGGEWNQPSGLPSGSEFPAGLTTNTYTYTDASGNEGSCSFTVEVLPSAEINVVTITPDQDGQGVGAIDIDVNGQEPYTYEWYLNGELVSTDEDPSGLNEGEYEVIVTDANGCTFTLENPVKVDNSTAAQEPAWMKGLEMRPNPATDQVQIIFSEVINTDLEISLIDATGRTLINQQVSKQKTLTLNLADMPQGLYFVKINSGDASGMRKLVISN